MINLAQVLRFKLFEDSSVGFMARLLLPNGSPCFKSNISAIHYYVYNKTDGGDPEEGDIDVDEVMFDTAQPWRYDSGGYTFLWSIPGDLMPEADKVYRSILKYTYYLPSSTFHGKKFKLVWEGTTESAA